MSSVLKSLLGAFVAAVVLTACSSSPSAPVSSAAFEPENVLTIGRGASEPAAAPISAPVAATPVASPSAPSADYAVATPTTLPDPAGSQNS
ncbi:MAG: hypothetical protein RJA95_796, partial [Verrucomicrobiota bacterium]